MKKIVLLLSITLFYSCSSILVYSDFDREVNFSDYKTFAYFKPEIDKVDKIFKVLFFVTLFP